MGYKQIKSNELDKLMAQGGVIILDIRAESSYALGHIPGAQHLSMQALQGFCQQTEKQSINVLVYCYHGISSQSVAQYLVEQGFTHVYSLVGGYEEWQQHHLPSTAASDKN
jgi:thiosulfate sulfurtransferase